MRSIYRIWSAVLLIGAQTASAARPPQVLLKPVQVRQLFRDFGGCIVRSSWYSQARKNLVDFLELPPNDPATIKLMLKFYDVCPMRSRQDVVITKVSWNAIVMRGAIVRALYVSEGGARPATKLTKEEMAAVLAAGSALDPSADRLAACVVAQDPAAADDFVRAEVASKAETSALARLAPSLNGCTDEDVRMSFAKAQLEYVLAEALYQRRIAMMK